MKYKFIYLSALLLLFVQIHAQEKELGKKDSGFTVSPQIGGQIEFTTVIFTNEIGGAVDLDILNKETDVNYSFGTRFSYEYISYYVPGGPTDGNPFSDYCLFIRHSAGSKKVDVSLLAGISSS